MADTPFEGWCVLELLGHRRLAGYVREVQLAGHGMLRLDVPEHVTARCTCGSALPDSPRHDDHQHDCWLFADDEQPPRDIAATQFYPPSALYCLTPTTEATARGIGARTKPQPVHRWELAPPVDARAADDDDDDDEGHPF